jgi:hypothetical protein
LRDDSDHETMTTAARETRTIDKQLKYVLSLFRSEREAIERCKDLISRCQEKIVRNKETIRQKECSMQVAIKSIEILNQQKKEAFEKEFQETRLIVERATAELKPVAVTTPVVMSESPSPREDALNNGTGNATEVANDDTTVDHTNGEVGITTVASNGGYNMPDPKRRRVSCEAASTENDARGVDV